MASSSLLNLVSLSTTPSKRSPPQQRKASLLHLSPSTSFSPFRNGNGSVSLIASNEGYKPLSSSSYNVEVLVDDNDNEERIVDIFRREVMRAGVIQECSRRRFFENKHDEKKRKNREAARRNRRRRPFVKDPSQDQEGTRSNEDERDDDNWELPVGDLPY